MSLLTSIQRYIQLGSFWSRRTSLYRDLAKGLSERELPKDFVEGELQISIAPKTSDRARASGLAYMRDLMDHGDPSLHEVLAATMPKADSLALSVLKDAKDRPASLRMLADTVDAQMALTKMVRQALTSPLILLPVGFAFAYLLSTLTIPEFAKAAPPEIWTGYNAAVRDSAEVIAKYGPAGAVVAVLGFAWLFLWGLPNLTARWRYRCESARGWERLLWILICPVQPAFAMYRDINGTRMLGNLANLLQSRMLLADALPALAEGAQPWMRRHLLVVNEHLMETPGDYVGAFSHGILSAYLLGRLHSMVRRDAGGKFDAVLIELGTVGQTEGREAVHKTAVTLNAVLLALTLSVIAFFYLGQSMIARSIEEANSPSAVMRRSLKRNQAREAASAVQVSHPAENSVSPR